MTTTFENILDAVVTVAMIGGGMTQIGGVEVSCKGDVWFAYKTGSNDQYVHFVATSKTDAAKRVAEFAGVHVPAWW
jgi:hypothetical protein